MDLKGGSDFREILTEKFGTAGGPRLYEMALEESGFVRPAELALEKIDPERYQMLLRVRFNTAP